MLTEGKDISALDSITEYFQRLYHIKGESLDKKKILEEFKDHEYNFAKVGKEFQLIEEDTVTVYVNCEPEAEKLLQEIRQKGLSKKLMRRAGQYCINVYRGENGKEGLFEKMYYDGMLQPVVDGAQDFYELVDKEQYQADTGLKLEVEQGKMLMC